MSGPLLGCDGRFGGDMPLNRACIDVAALYQCGSTVWMVDPQLVPVVEFRHGCRVVIENCARLYRGCMHDSRAEALFESVVTSNLLGMFELNCLGVTVESPVEDMADELRTALKRAAGGTDSSRTAQLRNTKALLGLLGSVDMPCEVLTTCTSEFSRLGGFASVSMVVQPVPCSHCLHVASVCDLVADVVKGTGDP